MEARFIQTQMEAVMTGKRRVFLDSDVRRVGRGWSGGEVWEVWGA